MFALSKNKWKIQQIKRVSVSERKFKKSNLVERSEQKRYLQVSECKTANGTRVRINQSVFCIANDDKQRERRT